MIYPNNMVVPGSRFLIPPHIIDNITHLYGRRLIQRDRSCTSVCQPLSAIFASQDTMRALFLKSATCLCFISITNFSKNWTRRKSMSLRLDFSSYSYGLEQMIDTKCNHRRKLTLYNMGCLFKPIISNQTPPFPIPDACVKPTNSGLAGTIPLQGGGCATIYVRIFLHYNSSLLRAVLIINEVGVPFLSALKFFISL